MRGRNLDADIAAARATIMTGLRNNVDTPAPTFACGASRHMQSLVLAAVVQTCLCRSSVDTLDATFWHIPAGAPDSAAQIVLHATFRV